MSEAAWVFRSRPAVPEYEPRPVALSCVGRRNETRDIVTFDFTVAPTPFRYLPGQAVTLTLPVDGETLYRTFTIASPPTRPEKLSLTIKAGADARASRWLHDHLMPGMTLAGRGPVGQFTIARHPTPAVALISGGSGATPMMAMLRWLADRRETTDVAWLHAARTPADVLFADEVAELAADRPALSHTNTVSHVPPGGSWRGPVGRIDAPMLAATIPDLAAREVFCCGPLAFMEAVAAIHEAMGGASERFHTETFGAYEAAPASLAADGMPVTVRFGARSFPASANATLLAAMDSAGVVIPTGCRDGICGTCRLVKRSGDVAMSHHGGLSAREERAGMILACCTRPLTDLVVERPVP